VAQAGLSLTEAVSTYTTLTVGDGLVSQIPAILVSIAAGIVVSKGATGERLQDDLFKQMQATSPALMLASGVATVAALIAGLPTIPLLTMFACTGGLAWNQARSKKLLEPLPPPPAPSAVPELVPTLDQVRIELGYGLLDLVNGSGRSIPDQIKKLRETLVAEMGFQMPSVRIQDNMSLQPNEYAFMVKEVRAGGGELQPTMMLAISPGDGATPVPGEITTEPTFGLPARWIAQGTVELARAGNWTVVDPGTVMITHLAEVMKEFMTELLTYNDTQRMIGDFPQQQKLVNDLVPAMITMGHLQRILQTLLSEQVSIRDLPTILEAVHEACSGATKSMAHIVATVRIRLSRQICEALVASDGYIPVITISPAWEDTLTEALTGAPEDRQLALGADRLRDLISAIRSTTESAVRSGMQPVLVSGQHLRTHLHGIVDRARIGIPVISHTEVHRRAKIKMVGSV
jgi:flagellar biosynthesis protein FlhA